MPASSRNALHQLSVALLLTIAICAKSSAFATDSATHLAASRFEAGVQDDEEAIIHELLEWAKTKGMADVLKTSPVKLSIAPSTPYRSRVSGRREISLSASRNIAQGEIILTLPAALHLTAPDDWDVLHGTDDPSIADLWGIAALGCWYLRQVAAGSASPFAPYIRTLPQHVPSPIFYPPHILQRFDDRSVEEAVNGWHRTFTQLFNHTLPSDRANASLSDFQWSASMVMSRAFGRREQWEEGEEGEEGGNGSKGRVMPLAAPVVDLIDHAVENNAERRDGVLNSSNFVAVRDISAGEGITISYGHKPSIRFLTDYGFVLPRNPYDFLPLAASKAELIGYFDLHAQREVGNEEEEMGAREMMGAVIGRVEGEVGIIMNYLSKSGAMVGKDLSSPQYDLSGGKLYSVWGNGAVDPRAFGAMAALWHIFYHQQEPDYVAMAAVALDFGWMTTNHSCESMARVAGLSDEEIESVRAGASLINAQLMGLLSSFHSTIDEDEQELMALRKCRRWVHHHGNLEGYDKSASCPADTLDWGHAMDIAIQYRMEKKRLLKGVSDRLLKNCIDKGVGEYDTINGREGVEDAHDEL